MLSSKDDFEEEFEDNKSGSHKSLFEKRDLPEEETKISNSPGKKLIIDVNDDDFFNESKPVI